MNGGDPTQSDQPDVIIVRSEEQLHITTRPVAVGRAILRKTIVTEQRTITVQIRHEEAHLEVVPVADPQPIAEGHQPAHRALPEFVLYREEITVTKKLVPVERVRMHLEQVLTHETVTTDLRKEQVTATATATAAANPAPQADLDEHPPGL